MSKNPVNTKNSTCRSVFSNFDPILILIVSVHKLIFGYTLQNISITLFCSLSWSVSASATKLLEFWRFYSASTASATTSSFDQSSLLHWPGCCPSCSSSAASPASDSDFILSKCCCCCGSCSLQIALATNPYTSIFKGKAGVSPSNTLGSI